MGRVDDSACVGARGGWGFGGGETAQPQRWRHGQDRLVKGASGAAVLQPEDAGSGIFGFMTRKTPVRAIAPGLWKPYQVPGQLSSFCEDVPAPDRARLTLDASAPGTAMISDPPD